MHTALTLVTLLAIVVAVSAAAGRLKLSAAAGPDRRGHRRLLPRLRARLRADPRDRADRPAAAAAVCRVDPHVADRLPDVPAADRAAERRAGAVHDGRRRVWSSGRCWTSSWRSASRSVPSWRRPTPSPPPRSPGGSACRDGSSRSSRARAWSTTRPRSSRCAPRSPRSPASVSVWQVGGGFLVSAVGGVLIGLAVAFVIGHIRKLIQDDVTDVAVSLLTPWIAYLPAEEIHIHGLDSQPSGVLAVVVAGVSSGTSRRASSRRRRGCSSAPTGPRSRTSWRTPSSC